MGAQSQHRLGKSKGQGCGGMSNKRKIYASAKIPPGFTPIHSEVLDCAAWKNLTLGARLLYVALLRRLSSKQWNNGRVFLATRKAAEELGVSQRAVCVWFRELEHYGFIVATEPGTIGPLGRATRWRLTYWTWGELDGKEITATKDYLKWDGVLFEARSKKQKIGEKRCSPRGRKVLTHDEKKYSGAPDSDEKKYSEGQPPDREKKYSDLELPSPYRESGEAGQPAAGSRHRPQCWTAAW
jgi:hypothetical protein